MKTLLIGLDGFDHALTCQWMESGKLPVLAGLAREGRFRLLPSLVPPVSPAIWTSLLTGVNPARHGVFDFTAVEGGRVRLLRGFPREAPNLFELLSLAGRKVASVGFPATSPPRLFSGALLGGWETPFSVGASRRGCHPPWLHDRLAGLYGRDYLLFDSIDQFRAREPGGAERALETLERMPRRRASLALSILQPGMIGPVDLLAVYFPEADAAGHQFWDLHDPGSPRGKPDRGRAGDPLERVYGAVDRAVGLLMEGYEPDAVVVVSDHGMGGSGNRVLSLNRFLEKAGYLKLGGRMKLAAMDAASGLARAAVMRLPARLRERAAEEGRGMADASLTFMRFAGRDWKRSEAFSEDLSYAPSIWINRLSAKAGGRVNELVRRIGRDMVHDPVMKDVVASLHGREELYSGPHLDRIPDILLDLSLDGGYSYNLVPGHFRSMRRVLEPLPGALRTGEKGKSRHGSHRPGGIWIVRAPAGRWERAADEPGLYDLTPLILSLYDLAVPGYFDSKAIFGGRISLDPGRLGPFPAAGDDGDGEAGARLRNRLEKLGYL
jgi:predicted AlkP superfamily phosphohydrolase/phosphomutase